MIPLRYTLEHDDLDPPAYAHEGDAGFDLRAAVPEKGIMLTEASAPVWIPTGLRFDIPPGYELQIRPRSGLSQFVRILNAPGTIDAGYIGEVKVLMHVQTNQYYRIKRNERIAQAVLAPVYRADLQPVSTIDKQTARGDGGFGSTGTE